MERERLYVIVPCFNEEGGIGPTVEEVLEHGQGLDVDLRVLMIDDGSTDATRARMEELAAAHEACTLLVNENNLGIGKSVVRAYGHVPEGAWVTVMPGDHEIAFASIDNFLEQRGRYDLILGYLQNPVIRTPGRRLASWAFTRVVSALYGFQWRYLNGLKMYRVEVFKGLEVVSGGHAFMPEAIAKAQLRWPQLRIGEAPFAARGRGLGRSKAIRPRSVLRAVADVYRGARSVGEFRRKVVSGEAV